MIKIPEEVIAEAERVFVETGTAMYNGIYKYDLIKYTGSADKVEIFCTVHQHSFFQTPNKHLAGHGCPKCNRMSGPNRLCTAYETCKSEAMKKFNGKFTYHDDTYVSNVKAMTITCPTHGDIRTTMKEHLKSESGCFLCDCPETPVVINESGASVLPSSIRSSSSNAKRAGRMKIRFLLRNYASCGKKICSRCKECVDLGQFYTSSSNKLLSVCKSCYGDIAKDNKEANKLKNAVWRAKNKEKLKGINDAKKLLADNASKNNYRSRKYANELARFSTYYVKLMPEDIATDGGEDRLLVKCKQCGAMFQPTNRQAQTRVAGAEGKVDGHPNFYCSNKCKELCDVHGAKIFPKSKRNGNIGKGRSCQASIRKQLIEVQCSSAGHTFCEICGDFLSQADVHHELQVSVFGNKASNPAGMVLVCGGCHVKIHNNCK